MISRPYGDDEAALAAASRGESAGLLQLFDSYAPLLFGVGQRILGDRGLAEEVLHDVFLEIWARAGDYRPTGATIRVWLLVHLRARALDRLRARVGKMVSLEDTQLAMVVGDDEAPGLGRAREQIQRIVDLLPPKQRNMLQLAYFEGLTSAQIADRVKVPLTRVASEIAAAVHSIRAAIADEASDAAPTVTDNLMAGYLLGELFEDERRRVDTILAAAASTPDESAALAAVHSVALYTLANRPTPRVRENLLASLTGRRRLLPFRGRVAALLDLDEDMTTTVLTTVDHRVGWTEEDPDARSRAIVVGPQRRDATARIVRVRAGGVLPRPLPATSAQLLVLAGRLRRDGGGEAAPGELLERPVGNRYRHEVLGQDEAIVLILTAEAAN
jgi:RNA polymerase sigma-70 factor (ECF subfamily)